MRVLKWEHKEYWQRQKDMEKRLDAITPEKRMTKEECDRLVCSTCGEGAMFRFDSYAMTRPDPWRLYSCGCKSKYLWVYCYK